MRLGGGPNPPGLLSCTREASSQCFRAHSEAENGLVNLPLTDLVPRLTAARMSCLRSSSWATVRSSLIHFCRSFHCSSLQLLKTPLSTSRLNSSSNSFLLLSLRVGCLLKSSHASSLPSRVFCCNSSYFLFASCCVRAAIRCNSRACRGRSRQQPSHLDSQTSRCDLRVSPQHAQLHCSASSYVFGAQCPGRVTRLDLARCPSRSRCHS